MDNYLQQVIGTDKNNPYLTLLQDEKLSKLYIYVGGVCYSVIDMHNENQKNVLLKIEIGKLFNAGVNQQALKKSFGFAISTMRRWATAIKTNDIEIISKATSGPGAPLKITPEINRFIQVRFNDIYKTNIYSYSKIIRDEISEVYQITITGETLRPIFNNLKEEFKKNLLSNLSQKSLSENSQDKVEKEASACDSNLKVATSETSEILKLSENKVVKNHEEINNRNNSLTLGINKEPDFEVLQGYGHHIGTMIFLPFINQISELIHTGKEFIKQWIILFLLGVHNVEQSKHIDFNSLELIFQNPMSQFLQKQRNILGELASNDSVIDSLILANARLVGAIQQTDFYFDPHSKHYTGEVNILKGWCGNLGRPAKALYMDFIHSSNGEPLYLEHFDNFYDIRESFFKIMLNFRIKTEIPNTQVITIVVDRGIFGMDFFRKILDSKILHIITWEKNYHHNQWEDNNETTEFSFHRFRNNSNDPFLYQFSFQEKKWGKNENMRQLIVKATNHKKNKIEVSILTDDFDRKGEEIITLIFKRWIQENDFKYLKKHFGLDELAEHKSTEYIKMRDKIEDKQVKSGEYKACEMAIKTLKNKIKKVLLDKHTTQKKLNENKAQQKLFLEGSEDIDKKEIRKLTLKITRGLKKIPEIEQNINNLEVQITIAESEKNGVEKRISKLEEMIKKEKSILLTPKKLLMDSMRIISRNIFYKALQKFKIDYNNYRDDHEIFRAFSRQSGYIYLTKVSLLLILNSTAKHQPKTIKIFDNYLSHFNEQNLHLGKNSSQKVKIVLWEKEEKLFDIKSDNIIKIMQKLESNSS